MIKVWLLKNTTKERLLLVQLFTSSNTVCSDSTRIGSNKWINNSCMLLSLSDEISRQMQKEKERKRKTSANTRETGEREHPQRGRDTRNVSERP